MPFLEVTQCPVALKQRRFPLKEGANTLGREKGCDIEIPDPRISGRHVVVMLRGDQVEIVDQNSTNGVFIFDNNKKRWEKRDAYELNNGDQIKIGRTVLHFMTS